GALAALGPRPSACKADRPASGRGQGRQPPKAVARPAPALRPAARRSTSTQLLLGEPSRLPPSPPRSFQLRLDLTPELWGARTTRLRRPPPCRSSSAHPRPPHPRLTSRDVLETPLRKAKRDATHIRQIRISVNRNLFARRD